MCGSKDNVVCGGFFVTLVSILMLFNLLAQGLTVMCWSVEVAAGFALGEALVLLYVCRRNAAFDRANALYHVPLFLQEALQAVLWCFVPQVASPEGVNCGVANKSLSYAVLLVVAGLPLWTTLVVVLQRRLLAPSLATTVVGPSKPAASVKDFDGAGRLPFEGILSRVIPVKSAETNGWVPQAIPEDWAGRSAANVKVATVLVAGAAIVMASRLVGLPELLPAPTRWLLNGPVCTARGPRGHQVWPFVVYEHWMLKVCAGAFYAWAGDGLWLLPRPSYVPFLMSACTFSALLLFFGLGDEWGSVWCWLASCSCLLYLVEPRLLKTYRVFDAEALRPDSGRQLRSSCGFLLAWANVHPEMWPWMIEEDAAGKELEEAIEAHGSGTATTE